MATGYPNREHENADKAARRRTLKAAGDLIQAAALIAKRVELGIAEGGDTSRLAGLARDLTEHVAVLGALRDVREWHAAGQAEER